MKAEVVLPKNEPDRLAELRRFEILDTPADGVFDSITAIAAELLQVPIAIISLVDHDRIWFKSHHGIEACEVGRDPGLCASAILSPKIYQVTDAKVDIRTLANPLVAGKLGLRFYAAAPLRTRLGHNLGTLCVIDQEPRVLKRSEGVMLKKLASLVMDQMELRLAAKKVADLEQGHRELGEKLRQAVRQAAESEEKFRDLFDEAPIAYVHEAIDSRVIRANRAATTMLGIRPEEIVGVLGKTFAADSADAQRRVSEAFASVGRGADTNGVVLELRRRDNGKPLWVQWWSRPDPGGKFTRTMFVDITERVLLEQEQARLKAQNEYLWEEIRSAHDFGSLIGDSPGLRKVMRQIKLVAPTNAAVLITGESGTGKELVARAIHEHSPRKDRVLIKLNCGAIPENLFESEFFGHMRGAFTGAVRDKPGRFELADGGTLFLDEIGEIPLAMQAKLLRVLQEREFERVGDTRTRKVNVRIVAATNRDLKKEVEAGRFRQDLYYRLVVFPVEIPPLRERQEDIAPLAAHFIRTTAKKMNLPAPRFTKAHAEQLGAYAWPGNIRELQNVVERAVIQSQGGGALHFDLVPAAPALHALPPRGGDGAQLITRSELKRRERESIVSALAQADGKVFGPDGAAALLGMKPTTLSSRIKSLGLQKK